MSSATSLAARIPAIDVLRGLAALLVTLHHTHLRFVIEKHDVATLLPRSIGNVLFWSGYHSVLVFFVISGFLITSLSLRRWSEPAPHFSRHVLPAACRPADAVPAAAARRAERAAPRAGSRLHHPARTREPRPRARRRPRVPRELAGRPPRLSARELGRALVALDRGNVLPAVPLACVLLRRERWLLVPLLALIVVGPFNRVALEGQAPLGRLSLALRHGRHRLRLPGRLDRHATPARRRECCARWPCWASR